MVQPVFMYPLVDKLTSFIQVIEIQTIQQILNSYEAIDKTDLEENAVNMMGPTTPQNL